LGGAIGNDQSLVTVDAGGVSVGNITFNYTDTYLYNRYTLQTGPITLADGGTIKKIGGYADSAAVIYSVIHGGAVNIGDGINSGAVHFRGNNDYTGVTTVKAGAGLWIGNPYDAAAVPLGLASAGTVVESGGSLCFAGTGNMSYGSEPLTLNGTGVGGIGALSSRLNAGGSWNGPITLGSDTRINSGGGGSAVSVQIATSLTGNNFNLTCGGTSGVTIHNMNLGSGSLTWDNTGNYQSDLRLYTANTFTGGLFINSTHKEAFVSVRNATSLGSADTAKVTFGPGAIGALELEVNVTVVGLNTDAGNPGQAYVMANGNRTLTINNATENTFAGVLENGPNLAYPFGFVGTLTLTKGAAGTLTLSGTNTYTGATTINGGMLVAGNTNALGTAGTITVNTNGTLGLAAGVTFTRAVTFNGGSGLGGSGTFATNGVWTLPANFTLKPGLSTNAVGTLTVDTGGNTLTATNGTRLEIDFDGAAGSDQLVVNGPLNLGTANDTLVLKGAIKGRSYVIASASSLSGRFVTVDKSGLDTPNATVIYPGDGTVVVFGPGGTSIIVQ
jgi:autotransporter-associated beta strand protein